VQLRVLPEPSWVASGCAGPIAKGGGIDQLSCMQVVCKSAYPSNHALPTRLKAFDAKPCGHLNVYCCQARTPPSGTRLTIVMFVRKVISFLRYLP
jgi:hypothetical protein